MYLERFTNDYESNSGRNRTGAGDILKKSNNSNVSPVTVAGRKSLIGNV